MMTSNSLPVLVDPRVMVITLIAFVILFAGLSDADPDNHHKSKHNDRSAQLNLVNSLKGQDICGALYHSHAHGYEIKEYEVVTKDNYVLKLHRLIHPMDKASGEPPAGAKKPYLLLHGLLGSSASYLRNIDNDFKAPDLTYNLKPEINRVLVSKESEYTHVWRSTADLFNEAYQGDKSNTIQSLSLTKKLLNLNPNKKFASVTDPDLDGDNLTFGPEFKQAYRKFEMPLGSKKYITNSLAMTLSNFGYDVWLLNLRGNHYSKKFSGRLSFNDPEYWDFDVQTVVREDMLASINYVKQKTRIAPKDTIGLVTYSYSSFHVLNMLTEFPDYQKLVQPVIMMAPTLMTSSQKNIKFKYFVKAITQFLVANNGPFPSIGRSKQDKLERLICKMPVASNLCKFFETFLHGSARTAKDIVFDGRGTSMIKKDAKCGQTSTATLHQIVENLNAAQIPPNYAPFLKARIRQEHGELIRRSVILLHSDSDEIATVDEVTKIRDFSLRLMTLADFLIHEPKFGHTDFLFSIKNQYLVNAEIIRMISVFDFLEKIKVANVDRSVSKKFPPSSPMRVRRPPSPPRGHPQGPPPPPRSAARSNPLVQQTQVGLGGYTAGEQVVGATSSLTNTVLPKEKSPPREPESGSQQQQQSTIPMTQRFPPRPRSMEK